MAKPRIAIRRQDEARAKIEHKITVLEKWARAGVPSDAYASERPPTSLTAFAAWEARAFYGLAAVERVAKSTLISKHPDLKELADVAIKKIRSRLRHRRPKKPHQERLKELQNARDEFKDLCDKLLSQYTAERHARLDADRLVADLQKTNERLVEETTGMHTELDRERNARIQAEHLVATLQEANEMLFEKSTELGAEVERLEELRSWP